MSAPSPQKNALSDFLQNYNISAIKEFKAMLCQTKLGGRNQKLKDYFITKILPQKDKISQDEFAHIVRSLSKTYRNNKIDADTVFTAIDGLITNCQAQESTNDPVKEPQPKAEKPKQKKQRQPVAKVSDHQTEDEDYDELILKSLVEAIKLIKSRRSDVQASDDDDEADDLEAEDGFTDDE